MMTTSFSVDAEKRTIVIKRTDDIMGAVIVDLILNGKELDTLLDALKRANRSSRRVFSATVTL